MHTEILAGITTFITVAYILILNPQILADPFAIVGNAGMTSFVTAIMFLAAIIFAPVVGIVPAAATAPALIFVGILMLSNIKEVDFSDMTNALPAFCTIVFMPFTYSIANGIAMGLISYCLLKVLSKRRSEVEVLTMVIAVVFAFRYAFMTLG